MPLSVTVSVTVWSWLAMLRWMRAAGGLYLSALELVQAIVWQDE